MLTDMITYMTSLDSTSAVCTDWGSTFVFNSNLFALVIPEYPNNLICLIPYGGEEPEIGHRDLYNPNLQIWIRNTDPLVAYNTGSSLIHTLHKEQSLVNGVCFALNSAPISTGLDTKGRVNYSCNFHLKVIIDIP